jgi:hypothetical protein
MQTFQRKTAKRIAAVTLLMAACASPLAWLVSRENAEQEVVAFAQEESRRVLSAHRSVRLDGPQAATQAQQAAQLLTGGFCLTLPKFTATMATSWPNLSRQKGTL